MLVLEWFENFRLRQQLEAGVDAARVFWRSEVLREGRPIKDSCHAHLTERSKIANRTLDSPALPARNSPSTCSQWIFPKT